MPKAAVLPTPPAWLLTKRERGWNDRFYISPPQVDPRRPPARDREELRPHRLNNNGGAAVGRQGMPINRKRGRPGLSLLVNDNGDRDVENSMVGGAQLPASSPRTEFTFALHNAATRACVYREQLLMQLNTVVVTWPPSAGDDRASNAASNPGNARPQAARFLRNLSVELREAGLRCVEKIVAWVLHTSPDAAEPAEFLWHGQNYLLKMHSDLDFVVGQIGTDATRIGNFSKANPLLLSRDELLSKNTGRLGRAAAATFVVMDVVKRWWQLHPEERREEMIDTNNDATRLPQIGSRRDGGDGAASNILPLPKAGGRPPKGVSNATPSFPAIGARKGAKKTKKVKKRGGKKLKQAKPERVKEEVIAVVVQNGQDAPNIRRKTPEREEAEEAFDEDIEEQEGRQTVKEDVKHTVGVEEAVPYVVAKEVRISESIRDMSRNREARTMDEGRLEVLALLGEGAYGVVHKCRVCEGNEKMSSPRVDVVAVKSFKAVESEGGEGELDEATRQYVAASQERELQLYDLLEGSEHIVKKFYDFREGGAAFIVLEYLPCNLLEVLNDSRFRTCAQNVCAVTLQLLKAVAFMHQQLIVHRDIKPENLLVNMATDPPTLKLTDFGTARVLPRGSNSSIAREESPDLTHYVGSRWYRAPEQLANSTLYSFGVDVWGCACILAELATGNPLFTGEDEAAVVGSIVSLLGALPFSVSKRLLRGGIDREAMTPCKQPVGEERTLDGLLVEPLGVMGVSLIKGMLAYDVTMRLSARDCLQHEYFEGGLGATVRVGDMDAHTHMASKAAPVHARMPRHSTPRGRGGDDDDAGGDGDGDYADEFEDDGGETEEPQQQEEKEEDDEDARGENDAAEDEVDAGLDVELGKDTDDDARLAQEEEEEEEDKAQSKESDSIEEGVLERQAKQREDVEAPSPAVVAWHVLRGKDGGFDERPLQQCSSQLIASKGTDNVSGEQQQQQQKQFEDVFVAELDVALRSNAITEGTWSDFGTYLERRQRGSDKVSQQQMHWALMSALSSCAERVFAPRAEAGREWVVELTGKLDYSKVVECARVVQKAKGDLSQEERKVLAVTSSLLSSLQKALPDRQMPGSPSLTALLSAVSPFVRQTDISTSLRMKALASLLDAVGVKTGSNVAACHLSPSCKALLVQGTLLTSDVKKINVVVDRKNILEDAEASLTKAGLLPAAGPGKRAGAGSGAATAVILNAYFTTTYGSKKVDGVFVEEGEGLGPRKELFALLGEKLQSRWKVVDDDVLQYTATATEGSPLLALEQQQQQQRQASVKSRAKEGGGSEKLQGSVLKEGQMVRVDLGGGRHEERIITRIERDDGYGKVHVRVDGMWSKAFSKQAVSIAQPVQPVVVYHQASESSWLNMSLLQSPSATTRLQLLGVLLGLTLVNECYLDLSLPPFFFQMLLAGDGGGGRYSEDEPVVDLLGVMSQLDESLGQSMDKVRAFSALELKQLLQAEGLPVDTTVDAYVATKVRDTFIEPVEWQLQAIRTGLLSVLPQAISATEALALTYDIVRLSCSDFGHMMCGPHKSKGETDFDFRDMFDVVEDNELVACLPLKEAFWQVVQQDLSQQERRGLLLFITGVATLPYPKSERLSIDMPFMSFSKDDHQRVLHTVPTAHTCDNVLELPNYWASLLYTNGFTSAASASSLSSFMEQKLKRQLREILQQKLRVAVENAAGYGLDGLQHRDNDDDDDDDDEKEDGRTQAETAALPSLATSNSPVASQAAALEADIPMLGERDSDDDDDKSMEIPHLGDIKAAITGRSDTSKTEAPTPHSAGSVNSDDSEDFMSFMQKEKDKRVAAETETEDNDEVIEAGGNNPKPGISKQQQQQQQQPPEPDDYAYDDDDNDFFGASPVGTGEDNAPKVSALGAKTDGGGDMNTKRARSNSGGSNYSFGSFSEHDMEE